MSILVEIFVRKYDERRRVVNFRDHAQIQISLDPSLFMVGGRRTSKRAKSKKYLSRASGGRSRAIILAQTNVDTKGCHFGYIGVVILVSDDERQRRCWPDGRPIAAAGTGAAAAKDGDAAGGSGSDAAADPARVGFGAAPAEAPPVRADRGRNRPERCCRCCRWCQG